MNSLIHEVLEIGYEWYLDNKAKNREFRLETALSTLEIKLSETEFKALYFRLIDTKFVSGEKKNFNFNGYNGLYFTNFGIYNIEHYADYTNYLLEVKERIINRWLSRCSVAIAILALIVSIIQFICQQKETNNIESRVQNIELQYLQAKRDSIKFLQEKIQNLKNQSKNDSLLTK